MKRTVVIAACVALLAFLAWRGIGAVRKPQETAKPAAARPPSRSRSPRCAAAPSGRSSASPGR